MFPAQRLMNLFGEFGASGLRVFISTANRIDGRLKILPFPFECVGQHLIERLGRRLPVALSVIIQLSFALAREQNHLHAPNCRLSSVFCQHRRREKPNTSTSTARYWSFTSRMHFAEPATRQHLGALVESVEL